jgi:hypothetical protein
VPAKTVPGLTLLSAALLAASADFRLGSDFTQRLYPGANATQIATDRSGALYLFSIFPGTSASSPPRFVVTKLTPDAATILWQNDLGFGVTAMAVDPDGGVYVLSSFESIAIGGIPPTSVSPLPWPAFASLAVMR